MATPTEIDFEKALTRPGTSPLARAVGARRLRSLYERLPTGALPKEVIFLRAVAIGMDLALKELKLTQTAQKD